MWHVWRLRGARHPLSRSMWPCCGGSRQCGAAGAARRRRGPRHRMPDAEELGAQNVEQRGRGTWHRSLSHAATCQRLPAELKPRTERAAPGEAKACQGALSARPCTGAPLRRMLSTTWQPAAVAVHPDVASSMTYPALHSSSSMDWTLGAISRLGRATSARNSASFSKVMVVPRCEGRGDSPPAKAEPVTLCERM